MDARCPECRYLLRGLIDLGGQKVRCTRCGHRFVPLVDEGIETQVISWLDDEDEGPADATPPMPKSATRRPTAAAPTQPEPKAKPAPPKPSTPKPSESQTKPFEPAPASASASASASTDTQTPTTPSVDHSKGYKEVAGKTKYKVVSAMKSTQQGAPEEQRINFRPVATTAHFDPYAEERNIEDEFSVMDPGQVRLMVEEISSKGTSIIFNSGLIKLKYFRASMPMACIVCGKDDPSSLTARPLVWIDRLKNSSTTAGEIEVLYQTRVKASWTCFDVIKAMTSMDKFSPPLTEPVPFYVCDKHMDIPATKCRTFDSAKGLFCRVVLPKPQIARDWLAAVNGMVDRYFVQIDEYIEHTEGGAWSDLDESVRQKIAAWFEFQNGEQFLGYFSDADFMLKDAGLAGVVLTDQRLVYCKYTKKGSIPLNEPGDLIGSETDAYFDLQHRVDDKSTKIAHVRKKDTEQMMSILVQMCNQDACKLRLLRA